jgi:hypothetical protein
MPIIPGQDGVADDFITTSSGATDEGKVPKLNASGELDESFFTATNIKTLKAGETINGATLPVAVYQSTSDNEVYACDGNDSAKIEFIGFAISNSTDGNNILVAVNGVIGGFTGLAEGTRYFVQDDKTIGTSIGSIEIMVGIAVSETELLIYKGSEQFLTSSTFSTTSASKVVVMPTLARKALLNAELVGASNEWQINSDLAIYRKGKTTATFRETINAAASPDQNKAIAVSLSGNNITVTGTSTAGSIGALNATVFYYR